MRRLAVRMGRCRNATGGQQVETCCICLKSIWCSTMKLQNLRLWTTCDNLGIGWLLEIPDGCLSRLRNMDRSWKSAIFQEAPETKPTTGQLAHRVARIPFYTSSSSWKGKFQGRYLVKETWIRLRKEWQWQYYDATRPPLQRHTVPTTNHLWARTPPIPPPNSSLTAKLRSWIKNHQTWLEDLGRWNPYLPRSSLCTKGRITPGGHHRTPSWRTTCRPLWTI